MEPKDRNYIKEIIEVKSSEYSEKQATSKATIAPIPNPGKEITNNQIRQEVTEKNYKVNSRYFM